MKFTLYTANCTGNEKNCLYPNVCIIENEADFAAAVERDHVTGRFRGNYRSIDNFEVSDCEVMDCDNDHSEDPAEWITPEILTERLDDIAFRVIYVHAKNVQSTKGGKDMIIHYRANGKDRKRLAEIIAKEIGVDAIYKGAPTFSYEMDYFTVDREGALVFDDENGGDEAERVLDAITAAGFTPLDEEPEEETPGIAIQMPMISGDELSRLEALIASKETLLKKAVGAESLMVGEKDGELDFAWFKADADPDEVKAYMHLVTALCRTAKESKRITGKDRPVENEKYAFRCFLLRLGFIGDEFKMSRKVLLQNFSGSSAFKGGARDEISE